MFRSEAGAKHRGAKHLRAKQNRREPSRIRGPSWFYFCKLYYVFLWGAGFGDSWHLLPVMIRSAFFGPCPPPFPTHCSVTDCRHGKGFFKIKKIRIFVTNSVNIIFLKPFVTYLSFIPRRVKKLKQFDKTTPLPIYIVG